MANDLVKCSFCGKSQRQVTKLVAGPYVRICNECVAQCNELLKDDPVPGERGRGTHADAAAVIERAVLALAELDPELAAELRAVGKQERDGDAGDPTEGSGPL